MPKIRILSEQLANQIAAGEVIERPASVVKELLENSLDAGADRIQVEVEGGGTRLLRVIDNGSGMDEDDVLLCLERHGTSKIHTTEDLEGIATLGFRGEAIPSIASVAQLTITSRPSGADLGSKAVVQYGKLTAIHEAGCPQGTIIEVRNLFGNTPARRKFLRTVRTELNHIDEVVRTYALAHPQVSFLLSIDGRQTLHLDISQNLSQRLSAVLNYQKTFITVEKQQHDRHRLLTALLIPPEQAGSTNGQLRLFINGRAVRDRMLAHAVTDGLHGFLMKGKSPSGMLHLRLPAEEVDVNVHPAKHEVRFRNAQDIHYFTVQAIAETMLAEQQRLQRELFGRPSTQPAAAISPPAPSWPEEIFPKPVKAPPAFSTTATSYQTAEPVRATAIYQEKSTVAAIELTAAAMETAPQQQKTNIQTAVDSEFSVQPSAAAARPDPLLPQDPNRHGLRIIGQFADLYILCANAEGLIVIDQHAAHERLLYEELQRQYRGRHLASQQLLFPASIELSVRQAQLLESFTEEIEQMGFAVQNFGGRSYIISAVPALTSHCSPQTLLTDLLAQLADGDQPGNERLIDAILASMACKAAIKSGHALSDREIDDLLNRMARAGLFSHCPHGRPVFRQFSHDQVKQWFFRS